MSWLVLVAMAIAPSMQQAAADELAKRLGPISGTFPLQREAIADPAQYRAWQCDRRAGKTTAAMTEFLQEGRDNPGDEYAYIALTRNSAKRIAWSMARQINRTYFCNARQYEQELRIVLPNEAALTLYGADAPHWVDRLFGQKLRRVYIDEAAFYSIDLYRLVFDVLEPTVADLEGTITLMSRPGHVNRGLFWNICAGKLKGWSVKKWSWRDNPNVCDQIEKRLADRIAHNPSLVEDPSFRRNWQNEWVSEAGARIYRIDIEQHGISEWETREGDQYVLGIDLGWHDHTAFSLITWSKRHDRVVELESYREHELLLDSVAARIRMYMEEYPGVVIVGDPGRRQAFEELRQRYDLPIDAADKTDKRHWIDQINTDLANNKIKIASPENSPHVEEMLDLTWDKRPSGKHIETPGRSNDCCDAFLYAYRHAWHFLHKEQDKPAELTIRQRWEQEADEMEQTEVDKYRSRNAGPWG